MFTIKLKLNSSFIDHHVNHWNWTNSGLNQEGFPLQNIKTRHKIIHSGMGQEDLIKTITHYVICVNQNWHKLIFYRHGTEDWVRVLRVKDRSSWVWNSYGWVIRVILQSALPYQLGCVKFSFRLVLLPALIFTCCCCSCSIGLIFFIRFTHVYA